MYNKNDFDSTDLEKIYKNIESFSNKIKNYKNILFICSDYPGSGGAATNCDKLQQFFSKSHKTFAIYYNFKNEQNIKIERNTKYMIAHQHELEYVLKNINYKPDIIILKNFVDINLKEIFNIPIIYLIAGIFTNKLDKYYYDIKDKVEYDKYINQSVLKQIKNSDYSFCNSSHTQEILKDIYGIETNLFYSSFVPYYNKQKQVEIDEKWNEREYEYGLIMSDFNRPIKNVEKSIEFLKDKDNVILIGKNSDQYKKYGFTCMDLVNKQNMKNYYKKIKYIVQNSFYESCSNVKIEGLFNGCNIYKTCKIIFGSGDYPMFGGAATNIYALSKFINTKHKYKSICIFNYSNFLSKEKLDPDNTNSVYHIKQWNQSSLKDDIIKILDGVPEIAYIKKCAVGYNLKKIFPKCKIIYILSSVIESESIKNNLFDENIIPDSIKCLTYTDTIIVNSKLSKDILYNFNNKVNISIAYTSLLINFEKKFKFIEYKNINNDWYNRKYDFGFVSSCCNRVVKNINLFLKIISKKKFNNKKSIIIGKNSYIYKFNENTTQYGLLNHNDLLNKLKDIKLIIITSRYESLSNLMFEALDAGCNILINPAIGGSEFINEKCIAFSLDDYIEKADFLTSKKYKCIKNNFNYSEDRLMNDLFLK
jgi:hypothetical protein